MKIYYSHHSWKHKTAIENYELDCIMKKFADDVNREIINSSDLLNQNGSVLTIWNKTYETIKKCDAFVFSTVSGMISLDEFNALLVALNSNIPIYQIEGNVCYELANVPIKEIIFENIMNTYANIYTPHKYHDRY